MNTLLLKNAIAVHHTSAVDTPWDAGENIGRLKAGESREYYEKMYAYRNPEANETTKAAYKLPHHTVSENGTPGAANINACIAAIAALNGARGGVDVPDAEREGIYKHLATHLQDAEMRPPALKMVEMELDTSGTTVERVYYSSLFGDRVRKGESVFVRGFASVNTEDRDGDYIDPALFEIETFLKNPQLWFNHEPWRDTDGNYKSIGKVVEAVPVKVTVLSDSPKLSLEYITGEKKGEVYRNDLNVVDFALKDGMRGLFVICEVLEPAIQEQIMDGRLNAFSWQGLMRRAKNGAVVGIDLMEVSIVIIPANQRATFQIGKTFSVIGTNGHRTIIDLTAIQSLVGSSGSASHRDELTDAEKMLVNQHNNVPGTPESVTTEGGESMEKQHIDAILDGIKAMSDAVDKLSERLVALEKQETVSGDSAGAAAPGIQGTLEGADNGDENVKVPEAAPDGTAPIIPADPPAAVIPGAADTELTEKITTAISAVAEEVVKIGRRVESLEKRPAESKVPSDAEAGAEQVQKALAGLAPDVRAHVHESALAKMLIPDAVIRASG